MLDVSHRRHFAEDGLPQRCRFTCRGSIWLTSAKVFAGQNHAQLTNLATHIRAPSQKKFGVNPGGLLNVNSFPDLGVYPCRLCQFPKGGPKPKFAFIFSKCASPAMPGAERQLNCPEKVAGGVQTTARKWPVDRVGRLATVRTSPVMAQSQYHLV